MISVNPVMAYAMALAFLSMKSVGVGKLALASAACFAFFVIFRLFHHVGDFLFAFLREPVLCLVAVDAAFLHGFASSDVF